MPSSPRALSGHVLPTRAFLVTISTKGDVTHECVCALVNHWKKTTVHAYVVREFGENEKLHLHAVLLYKEPRQSKKLHENFWDRYVKPYHPDSIGRYAVKVQVCPGNKWYDEYLQKEADGSHVLLDTYDRDAAVEFFPTQAVQEALVEAGKRKGLAAPHIEKHVSAWTESTFENSPEGAGAFLQHCMYVEKTMIPIADPRKLVEKSLMFWKYRNGIVCLNERELWLLKQLQDGPSYDVPTIRTQANVAARPSI